MKKRSTKDDIVGEVRLDHHNYSVQYLGYVPIVTMISRAYSIGIHFPSIPIKGVFTRISLEDSIPI